MQEVDSNTFRMVGDVHGEFKRLIKYSKAGIPTIQVGDYGLGFAGVTAPNIGPEHRFIRGNHDNPAACRLDPHYIPDGYVDEANSMMFVGGADSVDKDQRLEGVSWWRDEQLSYVELNDLLIEYETHRPAVMVTHDCPWFMYRHIKTYKIDYPNVTAKAFDSFFDAHQPQMWVFGHHHRSYRKVIRNCLFVCLNINEYMDIRSENGEITVVS